MLVSHFVKLFARRLNKKIETIATESMNARIGLQDLLDLATSGTDLEGVSGQHCLPAWVNEGYSDAKPAARNHLRIRSVERNKN
jgi:hypothetical protein